MDRLITILRAAHCRSTHQFFVLDAIPLVSSRQGQRLSSQLLKHYRQYLRGAKAPDKEFRDFRNHVVHVRDNHWGGAAKTAQKWYRDLLQEIQGGRWSDAAFCAGVLSHYFTDPLMPLHTAQSPKESVVHRPLEWSVTKSYERILQRHRDSRAPSSFEFRSDGDWLAGAVVDGAESSNQYYELLIDRYDLESGTRRPETGLDDRSVEVLADLFGLALSGWAGIIERAADESQAEIPEAPLSLASLVASISMPVAWIVRRIESVSEQNAVKAIFDEYQATGTVAKNLPPEIRNVREERKRDRMVSLKRSETNADGARVVPAAPTKSQRPTKDSDTETMTPRKGAILPLGSADGKKSANDATPSLAMSDDLVDAPSIGPKTAKRFARIGVTTVEQFLAASPSSLASQLDTSWINKETIIDWQDQARLVATVPGLCGYKSQLLVGVECRHREALAAAAPTTLHRQIEQFAATRAGKRALRSSRVPSKDDVAGWIDSAASSQFKQAG